MESLFKQVENWITNVIDQRITAAFTDLEIENIIDNCITDKLDDTVSNIVEDTLQQTFDISEYFDIRDYEDDIHEIVSQTFETKSIEILIPK